MTIAADSSLSELCFGSPVKPDIWHLRSFGSKPSIYYWSCDSNTEGATRSDSTRFLPSNTTSESAASGSEAAPASVLHHQLSHVALSGGLQTHKH